MSGFTDLDGKVAVVTGAASGIGRGIAQQLQAAGAQVVIADVEQEALDKAAEEMGVVGIRTDVSNYDSVDALARQVVERFGTVHVLVNNAGVGPLGRIADLSMSDWRWVLDVNLFGVIHGVQAFLPILKGNPEGGYIVNNSSMSGVMSAPKTACYTVSKFGVVALSEVLAMELEEEDSPIGVSVLMPGPTRSQIGSSFRNRSKHADTGLADVKMDELEVLDGIPWKEPTEIGDIVIEGMARGSLYVFTHAQMLETVRSRHRSIEAAADDAITRFG